MEKRLSGKRAIVTGAGQGLGVAIAGVLTREGARVLVTSRDPGKVAAAVERIRAAGGAAEGIRVDLLDPGAAERVTARAVEVLGGLDVLVNNAGTFLSRPFLEMSREDWEASIATNLSAPFYLIQAAARVMIGGGRGGAIVNIGSIHGAVAEPDLAAQAAAKAGLIGLTRAAAEALREHDIRVNAVCPGAIESDSAERTAVSPRRKATQADVAELVAYLASDSAAAITGSAVDIHGNTRVVLSYE